MTVLKGLFVAVAGLFVLAYAIHSFTPSRVSCTRSNCAGATVISGGNETVLGPGSCQTVGGDFSLAIAEKGYDFHLLSTPKAHGDYHSVVWRDRVDRQGGIVLGAKIELGRDATGQIVGSFSGRSTTGVRTTGSFNCG